jgi:hypothetical protein
MSIRDPYSALAWSWVSLDGKNIAAVPSYTRIDLMDTQDFSVLGRIFPDSRANHGVYHESPILLTQWNARRAFLVSLSSTAVVIHCPDSNSKAEKRRGVHFSFLWSMRLDFNAVMSVSISRCSFSLLLGGPTGISLWECDPNATGDVFAYECILKNLDHPCDLVEFAPSRCVFASALKGSPEVYVWRQHRRRSDHDSSQSAVLHKQVLGHDEGVEYMTWKPSTQDVDESDGHAKARWFESSRVLLTMTVQKTIRIWGESSSSMEKEGLLPCVMKCIAFLEPHSGMDIVIARWIVPRTQNISEAKTFQRMRKAEGSHDDHDHHHHHDQMKKKRRDWLSIVDTAGMLHVWQLELDRRSHENNYQNQNTSRLIATDFSFKVDGDESHDDRKDDNDDDDDGKRFKTSLVQEMHIVGTFSPTMTDGPTSFSIVLERTDHVLLSYTIGLSSPTTTATKTATTKMMMKNHTRRIDADQHDHLPHESHGPHVPKRPKMSMPILKEKSWYRGHTAPITSMAAHPSLPLVATTSAHEIMIFWLSLSTFSSESKLVPSCIINVQKRERITIKNTNDHENSIQSNATTSVPATCRANDTTVEVDDPIAAIHWLPTRFQDHPSTPDHHHQTSKQMNSNRIDINLPSHSQDSAIPLLLVTFLSGSFQVYHPALDSPPTMLRSPKMQTRQQLPRHQDHPMHYNIPRSRQESLLYPWTYFEHSNGSNESGFEYQVSLVPDKEFGFGLVFDKKKDDGKLVVCDFTVDPRNAMRQLPAAASGQIERMDECVAVEATVVKGKSLEEFRQVITMES